MLDCVIKNGTLVKPAGLCQADIGICGEKIVEIAPQLSGRETILAEGMLVIPGGVDPHVHLEMPAGKLTTSDNWETGTRAAVIGGTTTVIDFVEPSTPVQPLLQAFAERREQALGSSTVDFSFHMTLCAADETTLRQVPEVVAAGMPSFKLYTTYTGFALDDASLLRAFEAIGQAGGLAMVHAESDAIIQHATRQMQAAGRVALQDFPSSRPALAEVEAIERVLSLADYTGTTVYIAHISTQSGAAAIIRARSVGQAAWGETCPHYLLLNQSHYQGAGFDGAKYICCPPLRQPSDQRALWRALQAGGLQSIGSDHCCFNYLGQKDSTQGAFPGVPAGLPGIELRLALTYTFGVVSGHITLPQWVELCCTAPARLFGLHPRKGELAIGADADIVLFDPARKTIISKALLHENVDYSPYEGMMLTGMVDTTLLRGQVLVRGGKWAAPAAWGGGKTGTGKFVPGKRDAALC